VPLPPFAPTDLINTSAKSLQSGGSPINVAIARIWDNMTDFPASDFGWEKSPSKQWFHHFAEVCALH